MPSHWAGKTPGKREAKFSFQWRGRTKEGVSRWVGAPKGPTEWFSKVFIGYGLVAGTFGLGALGYIALHPEHWQTALWLALVGGIHGITFSITGLWMLNMRRKLLRMKSAEELAEEFGSTPELVKRLAEEHSIRPQININDTNLYNPQEFYASQILLRAASAPSAPETLLRAAEPTTPQSAPETLLRPAEAGVTPQSSSSASVDVSRYAETEEEESDVQAGG